MQICLKGVEFSYSDNGFRLGVPNWELGGAQKAAFVGPSGSGKTTLLRLLAGIMEPDAGKIELDDQNLCDLNDEERRAFRIQNVGFVFQDFRLVEYLDVRENLLLPFRINNALPMEAVDGVESLAESLGIAAHMEKYAGELSQGEKQRVAIGRALMPRPRLLLADEPTGNLDPDNTQRIMDLLFEQAADATMVMVTHDHSLTDHFDKVMDFGKLQI